MIGAKHCTVIHRRYASGMVNYEKSHCAHGCKRTIWEIYMTTISVTDFKKRVGSFIDEPLKEPVYITKHGRRFVALIDAVELELSLIHISEPTRPY